MSNALYVTMTHESFEMYACRGRGHWKDDLVVKGTGCFSRRPKFNSQYTLGGLQLSIILVLGDTTPSSGLWRHQHTYGAQICMQTKHPYT